MLFARLAGPCRNGSPGSNEQPKVHKPWPLVSCSMIVRALVLALLVLPAGRSVIAAEHGADSPLAILEAHVERAVTILEDPRYAAPAASDEQRKALCAVADQMFDVYAFSRLVLASGWQAFDTAGKQEFVETFAEFLCRYYISRLQLYYGGERVLFLGEDFKSEKRATVHAEVHVRGLEIPIDVRMGFREGRWRAYDIVVSGISAVLIYRAQFQPLLFKGQPQDLIEELRRRIAAEG